MGQERAETQKLQQREKREAERREKAGEERRKLKKKVGYEKGRRWESRKQVWNLIERGLTGHEN